MESDAEITIAFVFKRSGKQTLKFSEFYLPLSMELNWFSPQEARDFAKLALKHKLLQEKEGGIEPNFDIEKVKIPVGFRPTKKVFEIKEKAEVGKEVKEGNLLEKIAKSISEKTELDEKGIINEAIKISEEKNITIEVAALLIGKDHEIVLDEFHNDIKGNIEG